MPIEIDLHNNTSQIKIKPKSNDTIPADYGCKIDKARFEIALNEEIQNRILGDEELSKRIDELETTYVKYLNIDELEDGKINVSLVNDKGEIIDTKTITLTEKIIKEAEFDEENSKLIYTCNDDSVIELDISSIVDNVEELISKVAALESNLSILDGKVNTMNLTLSTIVNTTIPGINQQIGNINTTLSTLDTRVGKTELSIINIGKDVDTLRETKVETNLSIYPSIKPKDMEIEDVRDLLVYISENGTTGFNAKLSELGYSRIKNIEDIDKVDSGDILIDMD